MPTDSRGRTYFRKLFFKKVTSSRETFPLAEGDIALDEDDGKLYRGDGSTVGGILIQSTAGIALTDISSATTAPSGGGSLVYNNSNGQITYTPPDLSGFAGSVDAFKTISIAGQDSVVADSSTDTLTLVAGSNMTITTNAGGDSITFASSGGGGSQNLFSTIASAGQNNIVADGPTDTLYIEAGSGISIATDENTDTLTITATGGGGGLSNIVEDTTPQLGGTLDANGNTIDMGANIITDTKVGQWDTSYGWGNHASAGYLTALSLNTLSAGVIDTQNDSIAFIDANDSNNSKKETVADFLTAIAGSGISVSGGQLTSSLSDTDGLSEGTTNLYYTDARADARAQLKVDALVDAAPGTMDTLNELAAALGDDPNFATTTANNIATKLPLAGGTMAGAIDMGSNNITTTGKILFANMYSAEADLPNATTYHGMFAHVHATGAGYFAHGGNWIKLANDSQLSSYQTTAGLNSAIDTHLNQSGPTSGYVLSWNGSDYAWVANSGGSSNIINQGNSNVTVSDSGSDGSISFQTEGTGRWSFTSAGHLLLSLIHI